MATGCASSPAVSSAPKRDKRSVRHQLQLSFPSEELRDSCRTRLEHAFLRISKEYPCEWPPLLNQQYNLPIIIIY